MHLSGSSQKPKGATDQLDSGTHSIIIMQVLDSLAALNETRLRQSLQEWQSAARWRIEMKGICRKMIARMQHRHLTICMLTWQEAALKARHMRW